MLAMLVASAVTTGAASANSTLLSDGGFEFPALAHGETTRFFNAGDRVGPWTVTSGIVAVVGKFRPFEKPPLGTQMIRLLGVPSRADGEICQAANGMVVGAHYTLR